jgi:hypothetical protein
MRYEKPVAVPIPKRIAPDMVNYWVKDPEPVPTAMAKGDASDRPWLTKKATVEAGPSDSPDSYRVRREGATYIIKEVPNVIKEAPKVKIAEPKAAHKELRETAVSGSI